MSTPTPEVAQLGADALDPGAHLLLIDQRRIALRQHSMLCYSPNIRGSSFTSALT